MASYRDLVDAAKQQIEEIAPEDAERALTRSLVIDVRESDEFQSGSIPGAVHIPRGLLEGNIANRVPDTATSVILVCAGGMRSALAAKSLQEMGYESVRSLQGGFDRWKREDRPWTIPAVLAGDQRQRYSRHLVLPEVGEEGQRALLDARVLLVGAGGLGSPAALYLAAAGVGTISVVDHDVVELSNLQRQVLHGTDRVGLPKVESARTTLFDINPDVRVVGHKERLSADNVLDLIADHDVIVDATDNFPTRYLLNDAALRTRTTVVHGSVFRFEGQVTVFEPYRGPCYRCLAPLPPPPELAPSCAEAGVLGVMPGIIGSLQALEALKVVLGTGDALVGTLLAFDGLEGEFRRLTFRRDPECPACGDETNPPALVEYDEYCLPGR